MRPCTNSLAGLWPGLLRRRDARATLLCGLALLLGLGIHVQRTASGPPSRGRSYAFLVACDKYDPKQLNPLKYTRNDIIGFQNILLESGFKADDIIVLHEDQPRDLLPDYRTIWTQLKRLLARVGENDTLIVALSGHGERAFDIAIGLQAARLRQAPGDEVLTLAVAQLAGQAARGTMMRIQMEDLLNRGFGRVGIRIDEAPRLFEQRVHQHRIDDGISRIEITSLVQRFKRRIDGAYISLLAGTIDQFQRLFRALLILADQLV